MDYVPGAVRVIQFMLDQRVLANEFYDLFNQLFYSTELWGYLGVLGVTALCLIVIYQVKEVAPFGFIVLTLMGIDYIGRQVAGGYYIWHAVIALVGGVMCVIVGIQQFQKKSS